MAEIMLPQVELSRCLKAAYSAGMARQQIGRFLQAGYVPQPKQMMFHAAARLADLPLGPTLIAMGGARGPGKSHASMEQAGVDDCQRVPGLKVLFLRKVGKAAKESFNDLRRKTLKFVAHDYREYSGLLLFPNGSMILVGNFLREDGGITKSCGLANEKGWRILVGDKTHKAVRSRKENTPWTTIPHSLMKFELKSIQR